MRRIVNGVYYGWWVLAGAVVINALGGGTQFYGFSVFFLPLRESLGISAASASLIFSLARAEGAFEGPVVGYLIDRYGARLFLALGATIMGIGYLLLSTSQSFLSVLLIYLLVISVGFNAGFGHATLALVNNWFIRRRTLAMAIATSAFSIGGAIVAPLLGLAVARWDWRVAAALTGVAILVLSFPVSLVVRRSPESMGLRPDGDPPAFEASSGDSAAGTQSNGLKEFSLREAIRTSSFWLIMAGTALRLAVGGAFIVHFVAIMVWKGMDQTAAAGVLGVLALISIPFRLIMGWIGDRLPKARIIALTLVGGALSFLLLLFGQGSWYLWPFILAFALVESSPPLNWALIGDYFGRRNFATIRGAMTFFFGWGQMVMPFLAGVIWDRTQSYASVLWIFVVLWLISALIFAFLRPPRKKDISSLIQGYEPALGARSTHTE